MYNANVDIKTDLHPARRERLLGMAVGFYIPVCVVHISFRVSYFGHAQDFICTQNE